MNLVDRFLLLFLSIFILKAPSFSQNLPNNNSAEIYLQLKKLKVLGSVLYIAAHPDDENNTLLPFFAKEKLYRTAYLSLTRGDGGQNLIGSEQGIELGLIRTQELLAARKIDGAEQYFTRAYEFGYSKSSDETLKFWDKEKVLADIVWVIRQYKPDVIITRFPPDARAGHGHHTASCVLANQAFYDAANPEKFKEQFSYGVQPWQAKRIVWNTFNFGSTNTTNDSQLKLDVSSFNALLGKSYGEIGAEARSMHKSQGEGRPRRRGQLFEYFKHTAGDSAKNDLMEGIDISINRLSSENIGLEKLIDDIIKDYQIDKPEASVAPLVQLFKKIKSLPPSLWQEKKLEEIKQIIEACSSVFVEATTAQDFLVQGDTLKANFFITKRNNIDIKLKKIELETLDTSLNIAIKTNQNIVFSKPFIVNKNITQPYWLEKPQTDGMFRVDDQLQIGKSENDAPFVAIFNIEIEGELFQFHKPVLYKYVDPVKGELYQPLQILPAITVKETSNLKVVQPGKLNSVSIHYKALKPMDKVEILKDGKAFFIDSLSLKLNEERTFQSVYDIERKDKKNITDEEFINSFQLNNGKPALHDIHINYNHIPNLVYFKNASQKQLILNLKTVGKKVGYIIGAGDKVAEIVEQMGYEVDILQEKDITLENLKKYQAIITGIRAYNIYEWITNKNEVLNDYVKQGGNLLIQYIRSGLVNNKKIKVGPFPFTINSGLRVSEENAAVTLLLPNHPVLNFPNKIEISDFNNWVQERSTYQADKLDSAFVTPLQMNDANEKPSNGSLAIAAYGKGNVAYVSLVMFRQLPAGVPGALRLMANLIGLKNNQLKNSK